MIISDPAEIGDDADVCVVGAGPVGLALALSCARAGLKVLLLESGGLRPGREAGDLSDARIVKQHRHAPMTIASARAFGGTSHWWGGRCVPYDDVDFEVRRTAPEAAWPFGPEILAPWYRQAVEFLGCGPARFDMPAPGWEDLGDVRFDTLERWTPQTDIGAKYLDEVKRSSTLALALQTTVTSLMIEGDRVVGLEVVTPEGRRRVKSRRFVLAAGGLETTRLLLISQAQRTGLFGGPDGPLGRFYAGHISGKIADVALANPADVAAHDFFLDGQSYVRRRFTLKANAQRTGLLNTAFWLDNPPFYDSSHRSALLSAVWIALAIKPIGRLILSEGVRRSHVGPRPYASIQHLGNLLTGAVSGGFDLARILNGRFLSKPPRPGFLLRNRLGRYALHYHAEQSPSRSSLVKLTEDRDRNGTPRLEIDLQYQNIDVESVIRSHAILDRSLRDKGKGRLTYRLPEAERASSVLSQASDGFHQTGTTRMGASATNSVVNRDCRTHDLINLYIASSSVFPSSGQANPTLTATAVALRLADQMTNARQSMAA